MNSELRVQSAYGKGSVFSFEVMQKVVSFEPVGNIEKRIVIADECNNSSLWAPDAMILVTDDNVMNLAVIRGLLKRTGVQLYVASGGRETLALVREHKFDMVFLDHMMPEMDGIETYREIRRMWRNGEEIMTPQGTPFLVLTANAVAGAKEMYLEEGFHDYISKPVDAVYLEQMLRKYLPADYIANKTEHPQQGQAEAVSEKQERILDEAPEMTEYFIYMSKTRRANLERYLEITDLSSAALLLRELRYNVRVMKSCNETEKFIKILEETEQMAYDGNVEKLQRQMPALLRVWNRFEQEER